MGLNSLTVVLQRYLLPEHLEYFSFASAFTTGSCISDTLIVMLLLWFFMVVIANAISFSQVLGALH